MPGCITCDAADRISQIKRSDDAAWLQAVVKCVDNQKTVQQAAERRLRKLTKQKQPAK
jgi:hypothetical protein